MKRITLTLATCLFLLGFSLKAQDVDVNYADSTGLPGDNFSLQGALEMFKTAKSLEEFEKMLNQENNNVNNLDLNEDGKIDYVRVVDNFKNNAHAVVLQVPVNKTEFQDVAVIEIEKQGLDKVSVQIVGDQDIYGENVFFEPNNENQVGQGSSKGGPSCSYYTANMWFNAWYWPCIRFMYAPSYVVWVSPWYWDYYPNWWSPWGPYSWRNYYRHCYHYHHHYYRSYHHYGNNAYNAYKSHRRSSSYVENRHRSSLVNYRAQNGNYRRDNVAKTPTNLRRVDNGRVNKPNVNTNNYRKPNNPNNNYSKPRNNNGKTIDNNGRNQTNPQGNYNKRTPSNNNNGNVRPNESSRPTRPAKTNEPGRSKPAGNSKPAPSKHR
jgi:hypothetical protein